MRYGLLMKVCGVFAMIGLGTAALGDGFDCSKLRPKGNLPDKQKCKSINDENMKYGDRQAKCERHTQYVSKSSWAHRTVCGSSKTCRSPCIWDEQSGSGYCKASDKYKCSRSDYK